MMSMFHNLFDFMPQSRNPWLTPFPSAVNSAPELVDSESKDKKEVASSSAEPDAENVKLVMAQAECSEEKAVEALKKADGDLITASTSTFLLPYGTSF